ncbi:hypothetical protein FGF04_29000 [Streptomyces apricus]|uniref:Uncharacterized protein n=1 Tax=Streptomyces apricus TaxID=1828112 RepID=A0A5B0AND7_9ACTN|nr:hypothetical protein FGF04_29000 [Streptomyces apricus]
MRLHFAHSRVQRTWTVELRPQPGGSVLVCQHCVHSGRPVSGSSARAELMAHLAKHARGTPLPVHLRTCQCQERGCCWHRRHRGCHGPIRLLLARERGGRLWRLTDACAACAAATPEAAVVPDTILAATTLPTGRTNVRRRPRRPKEPDSQSRVREIFSYLAATLPANTGAAARLIALQCALRMNDSAEVRLPYGLLRSLRLGAASDSWLELAQARWLRALPHTPPTDRRMMVVQLLDRGLLSQHPARPDRLRAADWALRLTCSIRADFTPSPRLVTLCLAAHSAPGSTHGTAEVEQLARECGLSVITFISAMESLAMKEVVSSWDTGRNLEDLHWALAAPFQGAGLEPCQND